MADMLGKYSFLDIPDVNGQNVLIDAGGAPTIQAGTFAARPAFGVAGRLYVDTTNNLWYRDTGTAWVTIGAAGGTPGNPVDSVQFNNAGTFGGSSFMTWNSTTNSLRINNGTPNLQLNLGGLADPGTASLYVEVDSGATEIEAQRIYFNRGSAATSGWITNSYDGAAPRSRWIDGDDDPTYIRFDTVGTGTFANPQFQNSFGSLGATGAATNGFSFKANGTEIAAIGAQYLQIPVGTTAQRPGTPTAGMTRYNTTTTATEEYQNSAWIQRTGVIDKSVITVVTTTNATTNFINYTVPGGTLGTTNLLRLKTAGIWANASGATRQVTISVLYGATVIWQDTSGNLATGLDCGWSIDLMLASNNSVTSQTLNGVISIGGTGVVTTGITGDLGTDEILANAILTGTSAVNSAANQAFTVRTAFNGTGITWTKYYHVIEVL